MKGKVIDKSGKAGKEVSFPGNFGKAIRKDILLKVFEAQKEMQPYGTKYGAGAAYSASGISRKRRNVWKNTYGKGMSRIPRKIMSRHGASFNWIGATVASTRGGRRAHPPKPEKDTYRKINKKELLIAMNSGFAGTVDSDSLKKKYNIAVSVPLVFSSDVLELKTKDFLAVLKKALGDSYEKAVKKKSVRAGIGKMRGRKYKSNAGMVFVVGKDEKMNRKGIDVVKVNELKVSDLSPNGVPGRIAGYSEKALSEIAEVWK